MTGDESAADVQPNMPTILQSDRRETSTGTDDPAQAYPFTTEEGTHIQAMYETWVELEQSVGRAHDELRAILTNRERAASLRRDAEQVLEEGEAIGEEARRIGEAAWKAFDRGFAINPQGLAFRVARLREVHQAITTQAALQTASRREA